ncbi:MAG TPA: lysylphosphatidylglycerol synthase domain-containing protein [Steroidobacteraceae bacterium]|nr:lysylphosphatidylglycerol synthase domain-containing protein [Steroidobacteraceae bacterium]
MKYAAYIGGLLGLALLVTLVIRADFSAIMHTLGSGGWQLLWLIPYRALFFFLYAVGWLVLLRPYDPERRAGLGYLFWVAAVREAVDRLLPVASVGGSVVGIRLVRWRGLATAPIAASVIVEIVLTLIVLYLFTALGLCLLVEFGAAGQAYHRVLLAFLLTLPVPVASALLLRYGSAFERLHRFLRPLVGESTLSEQAASLDHELRASMRRALRLLLAGGLQFAAFISGSFEIWFALRLFGHPVGWGTAVVLESMTQAVRHLAFVVPAGIGVQEAGLVVFGHALGISGELALAVSMAKRTREVLCGLPALLSWQWLEGRRLSAQDYEPSR